MATKTIDSSAKPQQPPDERFWVKYSRHHELPISSLASLAWHLLAGVLIIVVGFIVARSRFADMPIETVQYGDGGGGGNPHGIGKGPGVGTMPLVEAASDRELPPDFVRPQDSLADITGLQIKPKDLLTDLDLDPQAERELAKITERGTQSLQKLAKLDEQLRKGLMGPPGRGKGGPGSGGGKGDGAGPGEGSGQGPSGQLNVRTKRKLRWRIVFSIANGQDYVRQLNALDAILAFQHPDGKLRVVKNLVQRPVTMEIEDVASYNRIFWIDDDGASVEKLARALNLDFTPREFVALFPHKFEQTLLDKELAFRNKREDQIHETRFVVMVRGSNYDVRVESQSLNGQ